MGEPSEEGEKVRKIEGKKGGGRAKGGNVNFRGGRHLLPTGHFSLRILV